ncbi:hypothetical protein AVEN_139582-1 [Araneus ventricosus]|uniref:Uncharacterized protein n=1 Tax=Araneus ventricosus TaxID=182803 RepID=A0A4Y2LPA7_ARAVE|nr:hypothetical protein AVEN_139582-1 [Araneus ventricosus]
MSRSLCTFVALNNASIMENEKNCLIIERPSSKEFHSRRKRLIAQLSDCRIKRTDNANTENENHLCPNGPKKVSIMFRYPSSSYRRYLFQRIITMGY